MATDHETLDRLPLRGGFRLRGGEMTRTETFTDAAFAFAITLLVISIDAVPTSLDELLTAMKGVPAFAMSFLLLILFWSGHRHWSRRFGQEDALSVMLSLALVFLVLVYVYPLKFLSALFMMWISGGQLSSNATISTADELHTIFVVYGTGFALMSLALVALNIHSLRCAAALNLNAAERLMTRQEATAWAIVASVGALSVLLALFTPPTRLMLPGWTYTLLAVIMPIYGFRADRKARQLAGPAPAPATTSSK